VAAGDFYDPLWLLLLSTGLRRSEALGVRWHDLDLDRGLLSVRQAVVTVHGEPVVGLPKSAAATRTVLLDADTVAALRAHRKRQAARQLAAAIWAEGDLVFTTGHGKPLHPGNIHRRYKELIAQAGVPDITMHDNRHTHATILLADRVPVKVVSERLGHARTSVTMDIYAHALPEMQEEAAASIGAALFG
jgi:integrase